MTGKAISFRVYGVPAPQGSKVPRKDKKTGRMWVVEQTAAHTESWRTAVTDAAVKAISAETAWVPFDLPVMLTAVFMFRRPKSHYGTGKNEKVLKASAMEFPVSGRQGDLSKLVRAVEDSLTDAGVWTDDKLVCRYGSLTGKYWVTGGQVPGALVHVQPAPRVNTGLPWPVSTEVH